jgi:iron(III) transport system permease protein
LLLNTSLLVLMPLCGAGHRHGLADRAQQSAGRRIWSMLAIAPLAVPAFVHSYAWISLLPAFNG